MDKFAYLLFIFILIVSYAIVVNCRHGLGRVFRIILFYYNITLGICILYLHSNCSIYIASKFSDSEKDRYIYYYFYLTCILLHPEIGIARIEIDYRYIFFFFRIHQVIEFQDSDIAVSI